MRTWNAEGQGRRGNRQKIKKEESKPRLGSIRNNRKEAHGDTSTLADMYIYVLPPAPYRGSSISSSPWTGEGKGGRAGIYGSQAENFHFSQGKTNSKPTHERPLLQQGGAGMSCPGGSPVPRKGEYGSLSHVLCLSGDQVNRDFLLLLAPRNVCRRPGTAAVFAGHRHPSCPLMQANRRSKVSFNVKELPFHWPEQGVETRGTQRGLQDGEGVEAIPALGQGPGSRFCVRLRR